MQDLVKMSLEELWELFPVSLTEHKDSWDEQYRKMEQVLVRALAGHQTERISHIGSTAVPDIAAKDIVDILVELGGEADMDGAAKAVESCGFLRMSQTGNRISLNRGYTSEGFASEVFHLHLRHAGDNDELYFRDYLLDHPDAAKEYEALKRRLVKPFRHDRDGYTEAKTPFIVRCTTAAKAAYGGRYAPRGHHAQD